jgi:hypothetical protein
LPETHRLTIFLEFAPRALESAGSDPHAFAETLSSRFEEVLAIDERSRSLQTLKPNPDQARV